MMNEATPGQVVQTNVKQGALIGGFVCFGLALAFMGVSLFTFFVYGPLLLAAFVLSIVAMAQRRTLGGVVLLLLTLIIPPVLGVGLAALRIAQGMADAPKASDPAKAPEVAEELKKFRISEARFRMKRGSREPVIDLTVRNDTKHPISRAYFTGTLSTPGRSIPWVKDDFNYEIPGGLEPGESATWHLVPRRGNWDEAPDRTDMVLTVVVTQLDGVDGKRLFDK
jgi:hypothetical protein